LKHIDKNFEKEFELMNLNEKNINKFYLNYVEELKLKLLNLVKTKKFNYNFYFFKLLIERNKNKILRYHKNDIKKKLKKFFKGRLLNTIQINANLIFRVIFYFDDIF
jgi:hypothetical protein